MNKAAEEFLNAVKKYKKILIIIQGSPDPDAIASSFAIKEILKTESIHSEIVSLKKISLSQNRAFVRLLDIPLKTSASFHPENFDAYIITDFQNSFVQGVSEKIPCAAHIDHHEKLPNPARADFRLVRTDSGSTSTIVSLMLKNLYDSARPVYLKGLCTALMFGIQTDTDSYEHVTELDIEALNFISAYADTDVINRLNGIPISASTLSFYSRAMDNGVLYKDWGFYGIGFIEVNQRDSMAVTADLLLKKTGLRTIAVYSIVNDPGKHELFLDVSLRTKSSTLDLNSLIKKITPAGGGRVYKGAYQVKLDYFRNAPEREILWNTAEAATLDWLRKSRDAAYLHELTGITKILFKKAVSYLKNE